jgi:hypothetical protein
VTERIGVTYLKVLNGISYHMALFYEASDGEKRVIEAAPQFDMGQVPVAAQAGELIGEVIKNRSIGVRVRIPNSCFFDSNNVITYDTNDSVTMQNVTLSNLTSNNFRFV